MNNAIWRVISAVIFSFVLLGCVSQPLSIEGEKKQRAAQARVELALNYLSQHQFELAKLNLDKALAHDDQYYLVYSAWAYFYQLQGEVESARQAYLTAIRLDPTQGNLHNNFGAFLCSQGEYEQAFAQFEQALNAPNYYAQGDTYENIALCAFALNQVETSQQALQSLQKLDAERAKKLAQRLK